MREGRLHALTPFDSKDVESMLLDSSFFVLFPISRGHTFFSEEIPSRWNQSAFLSFHSLLGRVCVRTKSRMGGSQWKRSAEGDDSALFFMDVFHLSFHFSSLLNAFFI